LAAAGVDSNTSLPGSRRGARRELQYLDADHLVVGVEVEHGARRRFLRLDDP
jgi:hypothetical protein